MSKNLSLAECGITVKDGECLFTAFRDFLLETHDNLVHYKGNAVKVPLLISSAAQQSIDNALAMIRQFLYTRGNTAQNAFSFTCGYHLKETP